MADVEQCLDLAVERGEIVVLDNVPAPKYEGAREGVGATLRYLPPCSAVFNPSELSLSALTFLRKSAERSEDGLRRRAARFVR